MHIKIIPNAHILIASEYDNGTKLLFFLALIIAIIHKINDIVHAIKNSIHKIFIIAYSSISKITFNMAFASERDSSASLTLLSYNFAKISFATFALGSVSTTRLLLCPDM